MAKIIDGDRTKSRSDLLDKKERLEEIARMVGGLTITESHRKAAKDMLEVARRPLRSARRAARGQADAIAGLKAVEGRAGGVLIAHASEAGRQADGATLGRVVGGAHCAQHAGFVRARHEHDAVAELGGAQEQRLGAAAWIARAPAHASRVGARDEDVDGARARLVAQLGLELGQRRRRRIDRHIDCHEAVRVLWKDRRHRSQEEHAGAEPGLFGRAAHRPGRWRIVAAEEELGRVRRDVDHRVGDRLDGVVADEGLVAEVPRVAEGLVRECAPPNDPPVRLPGEPPPRRRASSPACAATSSP